MVDQRYILLLFPFLMAGIWGYTELATRDTASQPDTHSGRMVYISEGCIHCHSQFSRTVGKDSELWAPASHVPDTGTAPVLIGNRRQGPDLSNIGLRRSREWDRLHLIHPNSISPGSRMPGYGHLFEEGSGEKGEALLDYLSGMVTDQTDEWQNQVYTWSPDGDIANGDAKNGCTSYLKHCSQCHGQDGVGDGPASKLLNASPRNLASGSFLYAPENLDPEARFIRLAQIIKYGVAGTSMPGHEYLQDQEIIDLLAYLSILRTNLRENANTDR